jgi:hypothetical protein
VFKQVYLRYKQVSQDPNAKLEETAMDPEDMSESPAVIAFPLKQEKHEVALENLPEGWYLICAEAVRRQEVLQKDCFLDKVVFVGSDNQSKMIFFS